MIFKRADERRGEARNPVKLKGVVSGAGVELACVITDLSPHGLRLRLDRSLPLPPRLTVIDVATGLAYDCESRWRDGMEAGFRILGQASLRGLTPGRLASARDAWSRAGGR